MSDHIERNEAKALARAGVDSIKQSLANGRIFHRPTQADMANLPLYIMQPGVYALHQGSEALQNIAYGFLGTFQTAPPDAKWVLAGGRKWEKDPPQSRYKLLDGKKLLSYVYVFKVSGAPPSTWYVLQVCRIESSDGDGDAAGDQAEEDEEEQDGNGNEMDLVTSTIPVQATVCDDIEKMQISIDMQAGQEIPTPFHTAGELQEDEWVKVEKSLVVNNICVKGKICCLSDEATKTNIVELKLDEHFQELLENIMKLKIIGFNDAMKQSRAGFSANNVQSVFPTCVSTVEVMNGKEHLTVDPMGIVAYLTLTVQGLAKQYQQDMKSILEMLVGDRPLRDLVEYTKVTLISDSDSESESSNNNGSKRPQKTKSAGLSIEQAGKEIARDLNEPNVDYLIERVRDIGITASLNLRDELLKNPPDDGRTLGGHFFRKSKSIQKSGASKDTLEKSSLYGKARDYQLKAVEKIGDNNAILVLPTGFGKTLVACMVVENTLKKRLGCALFVTQDRELARQQAAKFYRDGPPEWRRPGAILLAMGGDDIQKLNKNMVWETWSIQLNTSNWNKIVGETTILFITAGALVDTILCPKMKLNPVSGSTASSPEPVQLDKIPIVVLDEAHHAGEGSHNFVLALKEFRKREINAQLLGLSASPVSGTSDESQLRVRLRDLQLNLWNAKVVVPLEFPHVKSLASMTLERANPLALEYELIDVVEELVESIKEHCLELGGTGSQMPQAYGETFVEWTHERSVYFARNGDETRAAAFFALFRIVSSKLLIEDIGAIAANDLVSAILILQVHHHSGCGEVLNLILKSFVCEIARILNHPDFHSTKLVRLRTLLETGGAKKTLIRVATRRGVFWLTNYLQSQGFRAAALVGRSLMNESKIRQALEDFARGDIDILVGTSMVEEGIDLQSCDTVIAFSVLRLLNSGKSLIQNAGRARQSDSKLVVLCSDLKEEVQFSQLIEQVKAMFRVVNMCGSS